MEQGLLYVYYPDHYALHTLQLNNKITHLLHTNFILYLFFLLLSFFTLYVQFRPLS